MSLSIIFDLIVVAVFVVCVIGGMRKGLVKSVYRIFSFALAIILSIALLQPFSKLLDSTPIAETVRSGITNSIENTGGEMAASIDDTLSNLHLPSFLQDDISTDYLINSPEDDAAEFSVSEWVADALTGKIIGVLAAVILFIGIKLLLSLIFHMLDALFNLPVLHGVNKMLGAVLGLINGAIIIYGLCAVLTLVSANEAMTPIMTAIEKSLVTRCFYEYNVLLNLLTINHT